MAGPRGYYYLRQYLTNRREKGRDFARAERGGARFAICIDILVARRTRKSLCMITGCPFRRLPVTTDNL